MNNKKQDLLTKNVVYKGRTKKKIKLSDKIEFIIHNINDSIAGAESVEEIVDFLFEATTDFCPCHRLAISFIVERGKRVLLHYVRAEYPKLHLKKGYSEDLEKSSLRKLSSSKKTRIINDLKIYQQDNPHSEATKLLLKEGQRSSMVCPLVVKDRIIGFIFRSSKDPHAYDEHHLAVQLAINQRLSQSLEKIYLIEQLKREHHANVEMLGFISHELKNPLASMVTDAKILCEGYLGELSTRQKNKLARMTDKAEYLIGLVREYLELARLEGGELRLKAKIAVNFLKQIIQPTIDLTEREAKQQKCKISIDCPDKLLVNCDQELIRIVMTNLLGNAIKYSFEGGKIRVAAKVEKDRLKVSVWNEGPGFPYEQHEKLFRRFSRLESEELQKRKGSGIGLYTSWRIIQLHGGRIEANSVENSFAEFSFTIPQPLNKTIGYLEDDRPYYR